MELSASNFTPVEGLASQKVRISPRLAGGQQERGMAFESSAKQDRADRKLAKYISRRSLTIGVAVLAVVIVTAVLYGSYGG
jgi:uncharacterized membrane protein YdfJ with MMPL/SSD domain